MELATAIEKADSTSQVLIFILLGHVHEF
jgi:hypothetical protein